MTNNVLPLAAAAIVLNLVGCSEAIPCVVSTEAEASAAAGESACKQISVSGDFVDLSALAGLNHAADIELTDVPDLTSLRGLPPVDGQVDIVSAPKLESLVLSTSTALFLRDQEPAASVDATLFAASSGEVDRIQINSGRDISHLGARCDRSQCELFVVVAAQDDAITFDLSTEMRVSLVFDGAKETAIDSLTTMPLDTISALTFNESAPEAYPALRRLRDSLEERGYTGTLNLPDAIE